MRVNRNLAANDLAKIAEFSIEVFMVPIELFKALDKDASALDITTSRFTSDGVHVVR